MAYVRITVDGKEAFLAQLHQRLAKHEDKVSDAIQGAGIDMESGSKRRSPVGTPESTGIKGYRGGRLRAGNQYKKTGKLSCQVGNRVSYSRPINYGHVTRNPEVYVRPNPFWTATYLEVKQSLLKELKAIKV